MFSRFGALMTGSWTGRCFAAVQLPQSAVPGTTACARVGKKASEPKGSRATCMPAAGY